ITRNSFNPGNSRLAVARNPGRGGNRHDCRLPCPAWTSTGKQSNEADQPDFAPALARDAGAAADGGRRFLCRLHRHRVLAVDRCLREEARSEEHTSELQSREKLVCRLLLEKKKE